MSQHKYIVAKISKNKFHVGRLRVDEDNYEVFCTCTDKDKARQIMDEGVSEFLVCNADQIHYIYPEVTQYKEEDYDAFA